MSLSGTIDSFKTGTYTVKRRASGSYVDGKWVAGSDATSLVDMVAVPVDGQELQQLPEAYHSKSVYTVYAKTAIEIQDAVSKGDVITINGTDHTVFKLNVWVAFGETFYEGMAVGEPQ